MKKILPLISMFLVPFSAFAHNHEETSAFEEPSCYIEHPADVEKFDVVWSGGCSHGKANGSTLVKLYDKFGRPIGQFFGEAKNGELVIGVQDFMGNFKPVSYRAGQDQGDDIQKSFDIASKAAREYGKYLKSRGKDDLAKAYSARANKLYDQMRD